MAYLGTVAAGAAALLASTALAVGPAAAAQPDIFVLHIDETFPSRTGDACGFDILLHLEGTMRFTDFVDRDGALVRSLVTYPSLFYTFINAATGSSVTSRSPDPERYVWNDDGSFTLAVTGLVMHLVVPGEGVVAAQSGRFTIEVDADGQAVESEPVGRKDDYHAALCEVLAPTT